MLVFVSDLHLTDESFPPAIPVPRLTDAVTVLFEQAKARGIKRAQLVLLGDIFEIIKSPKWLADDLRPWDSPATGAHRDRVEAIFDSICRANAPFVAWLKSLPKLFPFVSLCYIPGNHDLAINTDMGFTVRPKLRAILSQAVSTGAFDTKFVDPDHSVLAVHGHQWDLNNRSGARGGPFGDAIVVEVLVQLPYRMEVLGTSRADIDFLFEIDNVRPQTPQTMSRWIETGLVRLHRENRDAIAKYEVVFDEILARLLALGRTNIFERNRYSSAWSQVVTWAGSKAVKLAGPRNAAWLFPMKEGDGYYATPARNLLNRAAHPQRFVLCGHTHIPEHVPLTVGAEGGLPSHYINTGTWRRVHRPTSVGKAGAKSPAFMSYQEECLAVIYNADDRRLGFPSYEFRRTTHGLD